MSDNAAGKVPSCSIWRGNHTTTFLTRRSPHIVGLMMSIWYVTNHLNTITGCELQSSVEDDGATSRTMIELRDSDWRMKVGPGLYK
jgi:hypothetical protein